MGWCIVVSEKGGREEVAERSISALGYEADFIWYRRLVERRVMVNGRRCRASLADSIIRRPLFGRYGFVLVPYGIDASDIDEARGVSRLLRHPPAKGDRAGKPKRVRSSLVTSWRARNAEQEFDDPRLRPKPAMRDDLVRGSQVRMPWRGDELTASVLGMDDAGRAEYLINMLGGATSWFTKEETAALELIEA